MWVNTGPSATFCCDTLREPAKTIKFNQCTEKLAGYTDPESNSKIQSYCVMCVQAYVVIRATYKRSIAQCYIELAFF